LGRNEKPMIYFFYGTDASKAKQKIKKLINVLLAKKSNALHFYFDDRSLDNEFIKGLFQSTGLFAEHHIIFLDRTFNVLESRDLIKEMKVSPHIFILLEDALNKKDLDYIKKYSEKSEEFRGEGAVKRESRPKVFALTDALGDRDRKRAWIIYRQFVDEGLSVEEILPVLFWQVKTMLMAKNSKGAKETGLEPFVYAKSKRYADKYSLDDLRNLSRVLVKALYDSRKGRDLENELEKVLLMV